MQQQVESQAYKLKRESSTQSDEIKSLGDELSAKTGDGVEMAFLYRA